MTNVTKRTNLTQGIQEIWVTQATQVTQITLVTQEIQVTKINQVIQVIQQVTKVTLVRESYFEYSFYNVWFVRAEYEKNSSWPSFFILSVLKAVYMETLNLLVCADNSTGTRVWLAAQ